MDAYDQNLHISDNAFEKMRSDADRVLQHLIKNMIEKDSMDGKVTIAIDVALTKEFIPNRAPEIYGETRMVLKPKFSHKIGSVMQIKNEAKEDINYDGMELVWDDEAGEYVLKPITNTSQMTIFDADFKCVNDPDENNESGSDAEREYGYPALEGECVAALPGPADENPDQDDMSGAFEDDGYSYEEPEEYDEDE